MFKLFGSLGDTHLWRWLSLHRVIQSLSVPSHVLSVEQSCGFSLCDAPFGAPESQFIKSSKLGHVVFCTVYFYHGLLSTYNIHKMLAFHFTPPHFCTDMQFRIYATSPISLFDYPLHSLSRCDMWVALILVSLTMEPALPNLRFSTGSGEKKEWVERRRLQSRTFNCCHEQFEMRGKRRGVEGE